MNSSLKVLFVLFFIATFSSGILFGHLLSPLYSSGNKCTQPTIKNIEVVRPALKTKELKPIDVLEENPKADLAPVIISKDLSKIFLKNELENYINLLKIAKAVPFTDSKSGELIGFKITNLKEDQFFNTLEIKKGDVLLAVNSQKINSVNKALDAFAETRNTLDKMNTFTVTVLRDEKFIDMNFNLVDDTN
jgi:type II secretory pathway component PulC